MGIDFRIGQAYINTEYDEAAISVERVDKTLIEGIGNLTPTDNYMHMAYSTFSEFIELTGTKELFDKLVPEHPYKLLLKENHLVELDKAIDNFRFNNPNVVARFAKELKEGDEGYDPRKPETWFAKDATFEDSCLARLLMFRHWIRWTLDNCSIPMFQNW